MTKIVSGFVAFCKTSRWGCFRRGQVDAFVGILANGAAYEVEFSDRKERTCAKICEKKALQNHLMGFVTKVRS
jgi:hypothetical protein